MSRDIRISLLIYSIAVFLTLVIFLDQACASPLSYNGIFSYRDEKEGPAQQTNIHNLNVNLTQDWSEYISASENIRYNNSWTEGSGTREIWSPTLDFLLKNEYYLLNLTGTATENIPDESFTTSTRAWDANWQSAWQKRYVPSLSLQYGQDQTFNDNDPKTLDLEDTYNRVGMLWDFNFVKLAANYNRSESTNNVSGVEDDEERFLASLDLSRSFWTDRMHFNFTQKYSTHQREVVGASGTVTRIDIEVSSQILSGIDTTPLAGTLTNAPLLRDNDTTAPALTINPGDEMNIGFFVDDQDVDKIFLYTDIDIGVNTANSIDWTVYSSPDGDTWTLESITIREGYSSPLRRFELSLIPAAQGHQFIKLVAGNTTVLLTPIVLTEAEAINEIDSTGAVTDDDTNHQTNVGLRYAPTANFDISYNLSLENNDSEILIQDYDRTTHSGRITWDPSIYFNSLLNYSEVINVQERNPETKNRSYSIKFASIPLPTLDMSIQGTRTDAYSDNQKTSTIDNYWSSMTAQLYRDLDAGLGLSYNKGINEETNTTQSEAFEASLTFTARITPKLMATIGSTYDDNIFDDSEAITYDAFFNYRMSDAISFQTNGSYTDATNSEDTKALTVTVNVAPTGNTQLFVSYDITETITSDENLNSNFRWNISSYLSVSSSFTYTKRELTGDDYTVLSSLGVNF